jgi:hypothetical protein
MATLLSVDRRTFRKTSAGGGAALLIGFHLPARASSDPAHAQEKPPINPLSSRATGIQPLG